MIYCVKCKKRTPDNNLSAKITKNKKPYVQSQCTICKKLKSQFVSINQIKGNGILNHLFKNISMLNKIF